MEKYSLAEKILGVSSADQADAVYEAYRNVSGLELNIQEFEGICKHLDAYDLNDWNNIPPEDQESITTLYIIRQIFEEGQVEWSNVLQHWPMYEACYRRLKSASSQDSGPRRALQVGCLTALSAAAFAALARDVYNAEPLTIDLTTSTMRAGYSNYVGTDALHMGLRDDSIDIAQTNCLLHMLESPRNPEADPENRANQFFSELFRVVRPGGHIILREIASNLDSREHPTYESEASKARFKRFRTEVVAGLAQVGFRSIMIEPATEIVGVGYLFDPTRNFAQYEQKERAATIAVSASKPSIVSKSQIAISQL
jgi:SAM-dependent methyltransferase